MAFTLLLFSIVGRAQNLAPNPGFEDYYDCPPYPGQIHEAVGWDSPNNNTSDYFHRCSPQEDGAGVPANLLGFQQPAEGEGYAGIRTWIPIIPGNPIYREYLSLRLPEPLEAGKKYAAQFKVSLAEESSHASDMLGLYLSKLPFANERLYQAEPQIQNPHGHILKNTAEWTPIAGAFVAEGGEQYLLIGAFQDDEEMARELVSENASPKVYYYIDEVVVKACIVPDTLSLEVDTAICAGSRLVVSGLPGALAYRWADGATSEERAITQPGRYSVASQMPCYDFTTIYEVSVQDCSCRPGQPVPQILSSSTADGALYFRDNEYTTLTRLDLFDVMGRKTAALLPGQLQNRSAFHLPAGAYFYQLFYHCTGPEGQIVPGMESGKLVVVW